MKIVLTFDSFEEFQEQVGRYAAKLKPKKPEAVPLEDVAAVLKAEEAKKEKLAPKQEPTPASDPEPVPEVKGEKPVTVTEDYRAEVRHMLHELNKTKNSKTAATDIIKTFGVNRLTDVPLSDLPALMEKAKEALDA